VVVLDSKSGRHIYSHAYEEKFGLTDHAPIDSLTLSSLLFALYINAKEISENVEEERERDREEERGEEEEGRGGEEEEERRGEEGGKMRGSKGEMSSSMSEEGGSTRSERAAPPPAGDTSHAHITPSLAVLEVGTSRIFFKQHSTLHVLAAVFLHKDIRHDIGQSIATSIVDRFVSKFEPILTTPSTAASGGPQRPRKIGGFSAVLQSIFQAIPEQLLEEIKEEMEPLAASSPWLYCFSSKTFFEAIDRGDKVVVDESRYGDGFRFATGKRRKGKAQRFKFSYYQKKRKRGEEGKGDLCSSGTGVHVLYSFAEDVHAAVRDSDMFMEAMRRVIFEASRLLALFSVCDKEEVGEDSKDVMQSLELEVGSIDRTKFLVRRFGHVVVALPVSSNSDGGTPSFLSIFSSASFEPRFKQLSLVLSFLERGKSSLPSLDLNGRGAITLSRPDR